MQATQPITTSMCGSPMVVFATFTASSLAGTIMAETTLSMDSISHLTTTIVSVKEFGKLLAEKISLNNLVQGARVNTQLEACGTRTPSLACALAIRRSATALDALTNSRASPRVSMPAACTSRLTRRSRHSTQRALISALNLSM
jgi:hypothetical protein